MEDRFLPAREIARIVGRTTAWVHLRGRQKKIRKRRTKNGVPVYSVNDATKIKIDNRPAVHYSVKRVVRQIAWVLDGLAYRQFSESEALARIGAIISGEES